MLFGIVISVFSWALQTFLKTDWAIIVLIFTVSFIAILIVVVFKLIVSPTKIDEVMSCIIILNLTKGCPEFFDPVWYEFSVIACEAFSGLTNKIPEIENKLKEFPDFKDKVFIDFGTFAIIEWLKKLQSPSNSFSGFGKNNYPIRFRGKLPAYKLSEKIIDENIFLKNEIGTPLPLNLPENMNIEVKDGALVLNHKIVKIIIKLIFHQSVQSIDNRTRLILEIPQDEKSDYVTVSGVISFKADFKFRSTFSRNADEYHGYVRNMLENLRAKYSWSEYLKNLREFAFWKHILKDD